MTVSGCAPFSAGVSPQDTNLDADMPAFLAACQPTLGLDFSEYAATLPSFFSGIEDAYRRGCVIMGLLDHQQATGPQEARQLPDFFKVVPHTAVQIGTSSRAHQILHDKKILGNVPLTLDQIAQTRAIDPTQFLQDGVLDWKTAIRHGMPAAWIGSWNFSQTASLQANTVLIILDVDLVLYCHHQIAANAQWVSENEPNFNKVMESLHRGMYNLESLSNPGSSASDASRR